MSAKTRTKKQYPENFKSLLGFSLPGFSYAFAGVVYGLFMQYLTDYSGIDQAVGKVGFAAAFGTGFMIFTRIIDAVDDPLQAFIMDGAKERKFGKYRMFTGISTILILVGLVMLFGIPASIKSAVVPLTIWIVVGYLIYEAGNAFHGVVPVLQKATKDAKIRTKVMTWYRMALVVGAVPATFFVPIATVLNQGIGDMGKSISITCFVIVGISSVISLIGVALLKEPYMPQMDEEKAKGPGVGLKDLIALLKTNKAMWVHDIAYIIGNSAYGFSGAMMVYFLKWYYCANVQTGAVNNEYYAAIYGISSAAGLILAFVAPLLAGWFTRKIGAVDKAARLCMLIAGVLYVIIFGCYFTGLLKDQPYIYIFLNFLVSIPTNMATVPFLLINVEVADYTEYKTGKNMTALTTSVMNLFTKTNTALSTAITGALLIAVNYSVDSVTGAYAGDVASIPGMINGFAIFISVVPALCCLVCWLMYRFLYPITPELRKNMAEKLEKMRNQGAEE